MSLLFTRASNNKKTFKIVIAGECLFHYVFFQRNNFNNLDACVLLTYTFTKSIEKLQYSYHPSDVYNHLPYQSENMQSTRN